MRKFFLSPLFIIFIALSVFSFLIPSFSGCANKAEDFAAGTSTQETSGESSSQNKKFDGKTLVITGSTTLLEVSNLWAEEFFNKYGGRITVNGGGSGEGITALLNKITDIANSSRDIKDSERENFINNNIELMEVPVLYDGISIIASKNITISDLSIEELSKIYTGQITNWKEVGGPDGEIILFSRDTNSGTGEYFLEEIVQLGKTEKENDYSQMTIRSNSNAEIVNNISDTDNCIGYIGLGFLSPETNSIKIKKDENSDAISPSIESVKNSSYPISRKLFIYADEGNLSEIAKAYIEFVLSEEGQGIGTKAGFVPVN